MASEIQAGPNRTSLVVMGTGTSVGVPVAGCECSVCLSANPKNKRSRCGVLVRAPGGDFVIDTPPELRLQLVDARCRLVHAAVYTHSHADHIMGLDDLRIFGFRLDANIPLYCEPNVEQQLRQSFNYAFSDTEQSHKYAVPRLEFVTIDDRPFELLGLEVLPLRLMHGKLPILGFRIGDVAFCTDVSSIPAESYQRLEGVRVLVLDTLREKPHPTHLSLPQALKVIRRVAPEQAYLTHLSHEFDYETTNRRLPENVELAFDGLEISVSL